MTEIDISKPKPRLATPTEARAIAALFLAAGATPEEVDGAVMELIEQSKDSAAPRSYGEIASQARDAIVAYRIKRDQPAVAVDQPE